jgi:hypothetical protein
MARSISEIHEYLQVEVKVKKGKDIPVTGRGVP